MKARFTIRPIYILREFIGRRAVLARNIARPKWNTIGAELSAGEKPAGPVFAATANS